MKDAAKLLQTTLDEEQATDIALTGIATSVVNQKAEGVTGSTRRWNRLHPKGRERCFPSIFTLVVLPRRTRAVNGSYNV
jgi:hypothetical protein